LLCCDECGCVTDRAQGWIAQILNDPESSDDGDEVAVHCPLCAQREFEVLSRRSAPYT
jgi:hypothetical protein